MKLSISFIFLMVIPFTASTMTLKINGVNKKGVEVNFMQLFKYVSLYETQFIANIPIIENKFKYEIEAEEIDIYMLVNDENNTFVTFIWDGELSLILDDNLSRTVIKNSSLTQDMRCFESNRYNECILPAIRHDSLIYVFKNSGDLKISSNKLKLESLYIESSKIHKDSENDFWKVTFQYIKEHPNSFLSLYYLTYTGKELTDNKYVNKFREAFRNLSPSLKKHSRAKIYQ